ncbi:MAG: hypothetical protein M3004_07055, partial [Bacteroidota bacterium]|nr:hypothetical protein [Bacteroidota bacterium]
GVNNNILKKKNESITTVTNNISPDIFRKKNDAIRRLAKSIVPPAIKSETAEKPEIKKEEIKKLSSEKIPLISTRISMNVFSAGELRANAAGCSYFEGKNKSNVIFFTNSVYGYLKINGKTFALQGIQKGNDVARFAGAGYEASVEIEGLAGTENNWVASCILIVRDVRQKILSTHKVYSSCTEF